MSAHGKVDEHTEQMMFFDYGINSPYLRYGVVDPAGSVVHFTGVDLPGPRLPHDMAITENYSILMDLPLYNDPAAAAAGRFKLYFDRSLPSRFAVLPRFGDGAQARWFEADPAYIYHTVNSWEEGDEIVLVACRVTKPAPITDHGHPLAQLLAYMRPEAQLHEYRFNLKTGASTERPLDDVNTEFPAIHQGRTGQRARWAYNMRLKVDQTLLFDALMKYDVLTGASEIHEFGPGNYGSEVVFIPRAGATAEDDGYLSMYCYNSATGRSEVWIYSALRVSDGPICVLGLPVRVPLGFPRHLGQRRADARRGAPRQPKRRADMTARLSVDLDRDLLAAAIEAVAARTGFTGFPGGADRDPDHRAASRGDAGRAARYDDRAQCRGRPGARHRRVLAVHARVTRHQLRDAVGARRGRARRRRGRAAAGRRAAAPRRGVPRDAEAALRPPGRIRRRDHAHHRAEHRDGRERQRGKRARPWPGGGRAGRRGDGPRARERDAGPSTAAAAPRAGCTSGTRSCRAGSHW